MLRPPAVPPRDDPRRRAASGATLRRTVDAIWGIESAKVIARVARMVGDVGLAEDLAQDALVGGARAVAGHGGARQPRCLADRHREAQGDRPAAPAPAARAKDRRARPRGDGRRRAHRRGRGRHRGRRRRPPPSDVHRLPSRAVPRRSGGPDPANGGRPADRRDRPGLPRARADARPAHRQGQADAARRRGPVRAAVPRRAGRPPRVGARGDLPGVQRGLLGHGRRRPPAARAVQRGPAARTAAGVAGARRARGARARGADGDPGLAGRRAHDARRPTPSCCSDQDRGLWNPAQIRAGWPHSTVPSRGGEDARGPYALQAAIAACHARARTADATDWPEIAALYDALAQIRPAR